MGCKTTCTFTFKKLWVVKLIIFPLFTTFPDLLSLQGEHGMQGGLTPNRLFSIYRILYI